MLLREGKLAAQNLCLPLQSLYMLYQTITMSTTALSGQSILNWSHLSAQASEGKSNFCLLLYQYFYIIMFIFLKNGRIINLIIYQ